MTEAIIITLAGVLLTTLCGAVGWLVRRIIANAHQVEALERDVHAARAAAERPEEDATARLLISQLELRCEQRYMSRESYVPQMALMSSKIDSLALSISRLDERLLNGRAT